MLCAALLCLVFVSCTMDAFKPYDGKEVFVRSEAYTDYNVDEFLAIAKSAFGLDESLIETIRTAVNYTKIKDLVVRFVPIVYKTVDPLGNEILASGSVVFPLNQKSTGVIDVMQFGYLANTQGGSENGLSTEQVFSFLRKTIISPNMLDAGISKRNHGVLPLGDDAPDGQPYHPWLDMDNTGRVAYDMHIAAAQYFEKERGEKLPKEIQIFGYSEGGADALAFNRWIDLHDNGNIIVKATYSGGGAHDLVAAFAALRESGIQFYPVIPAILYSIDFWDTSIAPDYSKIFTGPLMEPLPDVRNFRLLYNRAKYVWSIEEGLYGNRPLEELQKLNNLDVYMNASFFEDDWMSEESEFHYFKDYFEYNNTTADPNWIPRNPIHLFHAYGDIHIPEVCTRKAYENLLKKGANVTYDCCMDYQDNADPHMAGAIRFFVSCCGKFALN